MPLAFDGRTIADRYPGIGRYAHGVLSALGDDVSLTLTDRRLPNSRFDVRPPVLHSPGVRSVWSQVVIPLALGRRGITRYFSPYYLMPFGLSCDSVVTFYDATPLSDPALPITLKTAFRVLHRLAAWRAKRIIVLSEFARDELAGMGLPTSKMVVCPPGLGESFRPASAREIQQVRNQYRLPPKFLLCFGSAKRHKNTAAAWQAANDLPLVLVGGERVVASNVIRLPFVAEAQLPALYAAAHALLFPSLREGFGLPIIEAMACGTPVVCFAVGGVLQAAGSAALFAPDTSPQAMAHTVRQLDDPMIHRQTRERGLQWSARFSWSETTRAIMEL